MKLDLKNNSALWVAEASRLMGLAPVFAMMCAVVMVILAAFSVNDFLRATEMERKSQESGLSAQLQSTQYSFHWRPGYTRTRFRSAWAPPFCCRTLQLHR